MKAQQQQQARQMYFQTNLSKTEIADKLNISRRSVYQWSVEGDWEKLRTSARNMPSILAEKCYYLIGHFTDHLLSRDSNYQSVTKADVDILFKLAKTISMLKKGSTVNENMETFTFFLEGLQKRDANLAQALIPYTDTFISSRAATDPSSFIMDGFTKQGRKPLSEKEMMEKMLDEQDAAAILEEMQQNNVGVENLQPQNQPPNHAPHENNVGAENFQPQNQAPSQPTENSRPQNHVRTENHVDTENVQSLQHGGSSEKDKMGQQASKAA